LVLSSGERLGYDYAVIAAGASPAYYNVPGAREHSVGLYSPEDAARLKDMVRGGVDRVVIVGAGFVGVELAGELLWLRESRGLSYEVVLVDMLGEPLELLGNKMASVKARRVLERLGARLLLGRRVVSVDDKGVVLEGGKRVNADAVVWVAGLRGPGIGMPRGSQDAKGFIRVDRALRVPGFGGRVYAVGDAARLETKPYCLALKMAREALRSARVAVLNIALSLSGLPAREEYEPRITNCTPQVGLSIGPESGIVALGKSVAIESSMMNYYHEKMRRTYKRLLGGGI
jgi:NADH dehydrogenase